MGIVRKHPTTKAVKYDGRNFGCRVKTAMTFDTGAEARMWKIMLDEPGSDVIEAGRRWNSAQSRSEVVEGLVTEYTLGFSPSLHRPRSRECVVVGPRGKEAANTKRTNARNFQDVSIAAVPSGQMPLSSG